MILVGHRVFRARILPMLSQVGDVKDKVCVLLDDMSDTCGTLCKVTPSSTSVTFLSLFLFPLTTSRLPSSSFLNLLMASTRCMLFPYFYHKF